LEFSHTVSRAPRRSPPFAALCGWVLLCFLATTAVHAETTLIIRDGELKLGENVYELDTSLVIELDEGARRAIEGGLTMRLDYEIGISRIRNYLPDDGIASLVQSYELNYHALSQRYLVRNLNTGEQQDFGSLQGALDRVSELRGLPILDSALVEEGPTYEGRIRAVLDLNTAPDALGWLLFWTDDWSQESEWVVWTLRP